MPRTTRDVQRSVAVGVTKRVSIAQRCLMRQHRILRDLVVLFGLDKRRIAGERDVGCLGNTVETLVSTRNATLLCDALPGRISQANRVSSIGRPVWPASETASRAGQ